METGQLVSHEANVAPYDNFLLSSYGIDRKTPSGRRELKELFARATIKFSICGEKEDKLVVAGDSGGQKSMVSFLYIVDMLSGKML